MILLFYVVVTIFKPNNTEEALSPLPILVEPIHLPAADDSPSDEAVLIAEMSVGSSTGPLPEPSKADASTKSVLQMKGADKMALLKKSKKRPSVRAPPKAIVAPPPKPALKSTPPPPTILTVAEDSEGTEDQLLEPASKKPRLVEGPSHAEEVVAPINASSPKSKASSSGGSPTTCWPKSPADKFPFHLLDQFKLSGDDERFKNFSSEDFLVTYLRAQTQVFILICIYVFIHFFLLSDQFAYVFRPTPSSLELSLLLPDLPRERSS